MFVIEEQHHFGFSVSAVSPVSSQLFLWKQYVVDDVLRWTWYSRFLFLKAFQRHFKV
jgi:hypothetical protein